MTSGSIRRLSAPARDAAPMRTAVASCGRRTILRSSGKTAAMRRTEMKRTVYPVRHDEDERPWRTCPVGYSLDESETALRPVDAIADRVRRYPDNGSRLGVSWDSLTMLLRDCPSLAALWRSGRRTIYAAAASPFGTGASRPPKSGPSPDGSRSLSLRWWSTTERRRNHARHDRL